MQLQIRLNCSDKFGLRPDIWSDRKDQTEFWTGLQDKTERMSSLEKFHANKVSDRSLL